MTTSEPLDLTIRKMNRVMDENGEAAPELTIEDYESRRPDHGWGGNPIALLSVGRVRRYIVALVMLVCSTPLSAQELRKGATEWLLDPSHTARIAAIERDVVAVLPGEAEPVRMSLQRWLALYKIPGISVAVFDKGQLLWAKAYGVKESGQADVVTLDTLFQAGSISKPVTAMAALPFRGGGRWFPRRRDQHSAGVVATAAQ
jgi:hypothetical protein